MPWQILDLDPDTASEKDIKRSYARRVKVTRPDQDPEGFAKLHDAYSHALFLIGLRDNDQKSSPLATAEPVSIDPLLEKTENLENEIPFPQRQSTISVPATSVALSEITAAIDVLEQELKIEGRDCEPAVRSLEAVLYRNPDHAREWGGLVANLIETYSHRADLLFKPQALLFEVENESITATFAIISRMETQGREASITGISQFFLHHNKRMASPQGGFVFTRLAIASILWKCPFTSELCDQAYKNLAPNEREYHMMEIENTGGIAQALVGVPKEWRYFWYRRLRYPHAEYNWQDEQSTAALRLLGSSQARIWVGYQYLVDLVPDKSLIPKSVVADKTYAPISKTKPNNYQGDELSEQEWESEPPSRSSRKSQRILSNSGSNNAPEWEKPDERYSEHQNNHRNYKSAKSGGSMTVPIIAIFIGIKILFTIVTSCSRM